MTKHPLYGLGTALVTPFKNGEVDYEALDRLVEDQIANGVTALIAVGTTGEPATMNWEEHLAVIRRGVEKADHRVPVIAGTGSNDIAYAIESLLSDKYQGIYHICGGETLSVADIAYRVAKYFELDASLIQSVTTEEMNEATPRPLFSPMSTEKAFQEFGYQPSNLEDGLIEWK